MTEERIVDYYPLVHDIYEEYMALRHRDYSPEQAQELLLAENAREMQDEDDAWGVLSGIALAQYDMKELNDVVKAAAILAIGKKMDASNLPDEIHILSSICSCLASARTTNAARMKSKRKKYIPNWKNGDTFAHRLSHPEAEKTGIHGWYLLFRKVGEYLDYRGRTIQLGYLTVCPEEKIPRTSKEWDSIGFLRVMPHGDKWEYLVQVSIQSKRTENTLQFNRIGCFPDVGVPNDEQKSKPEVAMPLYSGTNQSTGLPEYEDVICRFYRSYGIGGK